MKSFKVLDGKVKVDGVLYGQSPKDDLVIMGKSGRIHSITIEGKGQFFPISGEFNDGTTPLVDDTTNVVETKTKKGKLAKTELVEKSGVAVDVDGNPIKKKRSKKK